MNSGTQQGDQIGYPSHVVNRFQCPFERNASGKEIPFDVDDLFRLHKLAFAAEISLAKARKDNLEIMIKNKEELLHALTDKEIFGKILEQGADAYEVGEDIKNYLRENRAYILDFFNSSVREESIFKLIPGLDLVDTLFTSSPDYPETIRVGQLLTYYNFAPVPPIGALAIFVLRQMHYKQFYREREIFDYPGSRVLLLFMLFVPVLLIINIVSITSRTLSVDKFLKIPLNFFASTLFNIGYYVPTFFTWMLDWYIFSRVWNRQ